MRIYRCSGSMYSTVPVRVTSSVLKEAMRKYLQNQEKHKVKKVAKKQKKVFLVENRRLGNWWIRGKVWPTLKLPIGISNPSSVLPTNIKLISLLRRTNLSIRLDIWCFSKQRIWMLWQRPLRNFLPRSWRKWISHPFVNDYWNTRVRLEKKISSVKEPNRKIEGRNVERRSDVTEIIAATDAGREEPFFSIGSFLQSQFHCNPCFPVPTSFDIKLSHITQKVNVTILYTVYYL